LLKIFTDSKIGANLFVGLGFLANSGRMKTRLMNIFEYLQDTRYYPGGVNSFLKR